MPLDFGSMSVPGASGLMSGFTSLAEQVAGETEDERKKRMAAMQQSARTGMTLGASTLMGSTGMGSLLGSLGGAGLGR